jgi:hypothetical protein
MRNDPSDRIQLLQGTLDMLILRTLNVWLRPLSGDRQTRETLALASLGITCGLPGALVAARLLAGFLYGVKPGDPIVWAASIGFLAATAAIAGYFPARRAARINPLVALREE